VKSQLGFRATSHSSDKISKVLINKLEHTIESSDVFQANNLSTSRVKSDAESFLKLSKKPQIFVGQETPIERKIPIIIGESKIKSHRYLSS
jgi:hypothetical protein